MKLSVMTYNYGRALAAGTLDLPGMLGECARLGVQGVELMAGHAAGRSAASVRSLLDDLGLAAPVLLESAAIAEPDTGRRKAAVAGLAPALELAQGLGCSCLMVLPSGGGNAPDAQVRRWIGAGLEEACALARGSGVRIIVENHGGAARLRGRVAHMEEFCAAAPDLRLCFDTGNFFLAGEELEPAYARLAARVVHVHCKDWSPAGEGIAALGDGRRYVGAAIGEGVVPNAALLARLRAAGYEGYVSVEYEGPDDPVAGTARAVAGLRRLLDG